MLTIPPKGGSLPDPPKAGQAGSLVGKWFDYAHHKWFDRLIIDGSAELTIKEKRC